MPANLSRHRWFVGCQELTPLYQNAKLRAQKQVAKHGTAEDIVEWKKYASRQIAAEYRKPNYAGLVQREGAKTLRKKIAVVKANRFLRKKFANV
jgi:hypothetical protein